MLLENAIDNANNKSNALLDLATQLVLKLVSNKIPKAISRPVAVLAKNGIKLSGTNEFKLLVYATKLCQLPQAETSFGHMPNRSAEADKNPALNAMRKNHSAILISDNFILLIYSFIKVKSTDDKVFFEIKFMCRCSKHFD